MKHVMECLLERIPQEDTVLVTIIAQTGSTPRGTGAQMLVGRAGRLAGTVGGGAVEGQAIRQAAMQLEAGSSCRVAYAMNGTQGGGLDMVCGGGAELLFSFVGRGDAAWRETAAAALRGLEESQPGALVLSAQEPPRFQNGESAAPFGGCLTGGRFVLPLPLHQRVIVFGGGHVAQALVPVLAGVGFQVTVFENRPEFADPGRFPGAHRVILGSYEDPARFLALRADDFFVIMTNGHASDYVLEAQLLRRPSAYIGVMGSRQKIASIHARLRADGIAEDAIRRVHTPIGLPIRAATPAEIAISIAAECIAVRAERRNQASGCCPAHR